MTPGNRHLALALAGAAGLHVAGAFALWWEVRDPGAVATGIGGIEISLGQAGAAAGAKPEVAPSEPERAPEPPPPDPPPPEPEPVAAPLPEAEPVPVAAPPVVAEAVPVETPEPPKVEPEPEPEPEARPVEKKPEPTPRERLAHLRPPEVRPKPPEPETPKVVQPPDPAPVEPPPDPVPQRQEPASTAPAVAGNQGEVGTTQQGAVGSGANEAGGGIAGARSDYLSVLRAWLERHKDYPRRAQLRRQEGTAFLYMSIDRSGRVVAYKLERSSGHRSLDHEVIEMVHRAQPLPRMPESMSEEHLELVVPVQFMLR